jgi:uncharacterized OsmC-like protein/alpha/beta superfamily hydrolase
MPTERLTFPGAQGGLLAARLELPAGRPPVACALFAHCFTCSKDSRAAVTISRSLAALGIAVLRFDFTGLGDSEGDFGQTTYSGSVDDLLAAARFLATRFQAPSLLIGHSLGGAAAIRAAGSLPDVKAVVTIGAPSDPAHALHLFEHASDQIAAQGSAPVTIAGRTFDVSRALVDDLREATLTDALRALDRALLIMHSPVDRVVPVAHAATLYTAARHPKSFVSLDSADHLLTQPGDAEYAAAVLSAWASRYLTESASAATDREDMGAQAYARTDADTGYRTALVVGGHQLQADEPIAVGGSDAGPAPFDLFSAALAACTSMTLQLYARRKGWPLEQAITRVSHERVTGAAPEGRADVFTRELELRGPLDEEQRTRLLEIAEKCPVHRTLTSGSDVTSTVRTDYL